MYDKVYDYIIIGSGFGGSVSAMRLSEKGYDCLVLEKGKEYKQNDFPKTNWNLPKYFWVPLFKWFGFQKLTFFKEVFVISGVGVGGGSLVYANTHMYPPDTFFNNKIWSSIKDWKAVLEPFYKTAKFMLGTTENKTFGKADSVLKELADDYGKPESFHGVDVGIYFGDTNNEKDPYFNGLGPKRLGCTECAGCMVGCRFNAKNTLDKNYLYFAKKNGCDVQAETLVTKIEFINDVYHIHTQSSTSWFSKNKTVFKCNGLVVSGGVLGTMDLLLKQKYKYKTLLNLSDTLGENFRTNSESLCGITANEKLNHGIAISSVFEPDEHTHIEIVKYPNKSNSMKLFASLATGDGSMFVRSLKLIGNIITKPHHVYKTWFNGKWAENSIIFLVMQNLDNSMKMVYKKFPFGKISIQNSKDNKVPAYIEPGQKAMHKFAEKVNAVPQNSIMEVLFNTSSTAHVLGGCPMGESSKTSVVNDKFEIHGYPKMYVLDGSIIPCNLGVNPSLTITALSEYAMSHISEKDGNIQKSIEEQMKEICK